MLILLSCAKTMSANSKAKVPFASVPRFQKEADDIAFQMSQFSVDELEKLLRVNAKIAVDNYKRYQQFHSLDAKKLPAMLSYTGIVFKKLNPIDFTTDDYDYAQHHLRLTSFCYGLLRPADAIVPYRLEGDAKLPELGGITLFEYWRKILTDTFIADINEAGGVLCNLASDEMRGLFDWKRVLQAVKVVTPEFSVMKNGKRTTIVVYTKMMRGLMTRYIIKNRIANLEELKQFQAEGFQYHPDLSTWDKPVFVLQA